MFINVRIPFTWTSTIIITLTCTSSRFIVPYIIQEKCLQLNATSAASALLKLHVLFSAYNFMYIIFVAYIKCFCFERQYNFKSRPDSEKVIAYFCNPPITITKLSCSDIHVPLLPQPELKTVKALMSFGVQTGVLDMYLLWNRTQGTRKIKVTCSKGLC